MTSVEAGGGMPDGIYYDLPAPKYHALKRLSSSEMRAHIDTTPAEAACKLAEPVEGFAVEVGNAIHAVVESGWDILVRPTGDTIDDDDRDRLKEELRAYKDKGVKLNWSTEALANWARAHTELPLWSREAARWRSRGMIPVSRAVFEVVERGVEAIYENPYAADIIDGSKSEVTYLWSEANHRGKARIDLDSRNWIVDLKTTGLDEALTGRGLDRLVNKRKWPEQLAYYGRGKMLCGAAYDSSTIHATLLTYVGDKGPALCEVVEYAPEWIERANRRIAAAIERWEYLRNNPDAWQGYSATNSKTPGIVHLEMPQYLEE